MPNSLGSSRLTSRAALAGTGLLLAVGLALSVAAALEPRLPGDMLVARWVQSLATPWLDTLMKAVTLLGMTYVAGASILAAAAAFALARRWPEVAAFIGAAVMEGAVQVLKSLIGRPRPPEELLRILESGASGSFPSGHVYHAVVFGGLLLALVVPGIRPDLSGLRRAVAVLVLLLAVAIAVSRVYLGAHWPSDVLGSVALGIPSLAMLVYLCRRLGGGESSPQEDGPRQ
ncbi:MAG: phosphatase PAP2 family protein [Dehalococcoidia bacterium]|nr:phosphatase PAP2 family protein [Dehalococcoidia bacterium]